MKGIDHPDHLERLASRYRLGERLGGGGMAVVHRAYDESLHREVAVKLLDASRGLDPNLQARFESEARAAASISHPRVVAVHDVGTDGDLLYIVMECLPGTTLADELRASGPLPIDRAIVVLTDVLDGLGAAHARGVLHRDIKPSNVLIDSDGRAKVADFGIATTAGGDLTKTGTVIGSAAYLAPERVDGRRATERSDLYAVGVVAYEALTGRRPFSGETPIALARAIHEGRAPRPCDVRPEIPGYFADVVMRAMARDPAERPPTAAEFARELDASVLTVASSVRSDETRTATLPRVAPIEPKRQRSWRPLALLFAGCIAFGLVVGTLWAATRDDGGSSPAPLEPTVPIPSEPTAPPESLPPPLEDAFDRLDELVQP